MGGERLATRAFVAAFNFKREMQERKVGTLSGGERNRVHLAKAIRRGCNLLCLDEPSNDLDVDTLRALEEALADFTGAALVVSHDRWFLERICSHVLVFTDSATAAAANAIANANASGAQAAGAQPAQATDATATAAAGDGGTAAKSNVIFFAGSLAEFLARAGSAGGGASAAAASAAAKADSSAADTARRTAAAFHRTSL